MTFYLKDVETVNSQVVWRERNQIGILPKSLQRTVRGSHLPPAEPDSAQEMQLISALRPGSSVVERGPEKAGVGGSIPSLATIISTGEFPAALGFLRRSAVMLTAARGRPASAVQSRPWPPSFCLPNAPAALTCLRGARLPTSEQHWLVIPMSLLIVTDRHSRWSCHWLCGHEFVRIMFKLLDSIN